jgi:hypothetical protein
MEPDGNGLVWTILLRTLQLHLGFSDDDGLSWTSYGGHPLRHLFRIPRFNQGAAYDRFIERSPFLPTLLLNFFQRRFWPLMSGEMNHR